MVAVPVWRNDARGVTSLWDGWASGIEAHGGVPILDPREPSFDWGPPIALEFPASVLDRPKVAIKRGSPRRSRLPACGRRPSWLGPVPGGGRT